jgi:hypothetical protein
MRGPTREDYALWQSIGFIGTWEEYSAIKSKHEGSVMFIRGDLGDHCADCAGFGDFLCDFPVGDGKTCDRLMCDDHANEIAPEVHYCAAHLKMWEEFKAAGGVAAELANVVAFPKPR